MKIEKCPTHNEYPQIYSVCEEGYANDAPPLMIHCPHATWDDDAESVEDKDYCGAMVGCPLHFIVEDDSNISTIIVVWNDKVKELNDKT